jgi:hypothetical protein
VIYSACCEGSDRERGVGVPSREVERIGGSVHRTSERGGFFKRIERN